MIQISLDRFTHSYLTIVCNKYQFTLHCTKMAERKWESSQWRLLKPLPLLKALYLFSRFLAKKFAIKLLSHFYSKIINFSFESNYLVFNKVLVFPFFWIIAIIFTKYLINIPLTINTEKIRR